MNVDRLLERMEEVLEQAKEVRPEWPLGSPYAIVDRGPAMRWMMSASQVVKAAFGEDSHYCRQLDKERGGFDRQFPIFEACYGILQAARDDLAAGMLTTIQELAAAEVFDDMLAMALHLHQNGYHIAAVSIAGAVLEDNLRKLHAREVGPVPEESKISVLNDALKDFYGQPTWRQVQTWGDIRNDADHGRYSNSDQQQTLDEKGEPYPVIDPREVRHMIDWTRDFMTKHLT